MLQTPEYNRGINRSTLILTAEQDYKSEQDSIKMFQHNKIPYFLDMNIQQQNLCLQFHYDIISKRSIEQILDYKTLDYCLLQQILDAFDQACMQTERYMLQENDILLNPEFVFLDSQSEQVLFCYLPGYQSDICQQFQRFMEYLLQRLDHKDEKAVQLAYGVYQKVTDEQAALHTVLSGIGRGIIKLDTNFQKPQDHTLTQNTDKQSIHQDAEEKIRQEDDARVPFYHYSENKKKPEKNIHLSSKQQDEQRRKREKANFSTKTQQKEVTKKQSSEKLKNMLRKKLYTDDYRKLEEDLVYEPEEELMVSHPTVCLTSETKEIQNQFIYQGTDRTRDFYCIEGKMILGSSVKESDICIPLPMVSRVHAKIEVSDEGTFLEDMNSTNGTLVNGELLNYRERRMLQKGDIISLAGENYSFH